MNNIELAAVVFAAVNEPIDYGPCAYCDQPKQYPFMAICYDCWLIEQAYVRDMEIQYQFPTVVDDEEIPF